MSGPITSAYTLMTRRGGIVIAVEVRLDKSKAREVAVQLASRSLTLVLCLSERANLKFRLQLHYEYKVAMEVSTFACRTLQPVDTCNPFTDELACLSFVLKRVCFKGE